MVEPLEVFVLRIVVILFWMVALAFQEFRINKIKEENRRLKIETPEIIRNARTFQVFLEIFLVLEIVWLLVQNAGGSVPPIAELVMRGFAATIMVWFLMPVPRPLLKTF